MKGLQQLQRDASGLRLRGVQVTRLETFDAAFAFALTLLAIFTSGLPRTAAELCEALLATTPSRGTA